MSSGFIQYLRNSERSKELRRKHPNAFLLLSLIAERARWAGHIDDGRELGTAELGDFKEAGIKTRKIYRRALEILEKEDYIIIIETQKKTKSMVHSGKSMVQIGATKRATNEATKRATNGTLVKLVDTSVWDINQEKEKKEKATKRATNEATKRATVRATEGPPKGHKRRRKEGKKELDSLSKDNSSNSPPQPPKGEKREGGRKEPYRHQEKISKEAVDLHHFSVDKNCACSDHIIQKWIDELDGNHEFVKREIDAVSKLEGIFSPPAFIGGRIANLKKSFHPEIENRADENRKIIETYLEKANQSMKKLFKILTHFVRIHLQNEWKSIYYVSPTFNFEWDEAKKQLTKRL